MATDAHVGGGAAGGDAGDAGRSAFGIGPRRGVRFAACTACPRVVGHAVHASCSWGNEMIIARSPLRISLGGGGTDLPSYYREFGGFLIAAAIDKGVYVCVHRTFLAEMVVR